MTTTTPALNLISLTALLLFILPEMGHSQSTYKDVANKKVEVPKELDYKQKSQRLLKAAIEEKECAGIAAGFSVDGAINWQGADGFRDCKEKRPFEATTITRIASIAKPMTAVAIMQLYEKGKIDLDQPIQNYLSAFPEKKEGQITTRQLLQHSAGIGAYSSQKERENTKHYPTLADASGIFKDRDLVAVPGTAFNYSTYGYVLLGLIIEEISGMSYEDYLQKNIWDVVGMNHTGVEHFEIYYPEKSLLYHQKKKGKIKEVQLTDLSDRVPGGGIYSCVPDLLKFGDALLNQQLIKTETFQLMMEDSGLKKEGNAYGLGFYLYGQNPRYGNVVGHTGGQSGVSAMFMLLPEVNTSVIVLSNTSRAMQRVSNIAVQLFDLANESKKK